MRHIGNLPSEGQARLFGDYLFAQGVRNEVERDSDTSWMVWVADEEQIETARGLLERFRQNPSAPEFSRKAADAEKLRAKETKENEAYRKRFYTSQRVFRRSQAYGAGVVTYLLIAACVAVTFLSKFGQNEAILQHLFISYPETGMTGFLPEVRAGEIWRLFTPVLIHFGMLHLLGNMMWLFFLGNMIEGLQGHSRLGILVLVIAVVSNVAQYAVTGSPFFGGMSGVVYGLFGYVWLRGKFDPGSGLFIDRFNFILMIVWFFVCFTGAVGHIANVAHATGLVLGAVWGFLSALVARHG